MRLSKRIEKLEGQQVPRPMLIGVRNLDGTVWADVPGRDRETFKNTEHFKGCAAILNMNHFCVVLVAPRSPTMEVVHANVPTMNHTHAENGE